ncbi:hypothetical protein TNCV_2925161 [Trichonephila clavipes]|nr:hypothetical protein TNCV_2925161 [Trichonephila clavipes]
MRCLSDRNVAQNLSEFTVNPLVRNSMQSTPLAFQKMVNMTFVADIKVLNFLTLRVVGGPYSMDCLFFLGHNDESRIQKFRQSCQMDSQPTRIFLNGRNEEVDRTFEELRGC